MLSRRQVLKASPLLAGGAIFNSAHAQTPRGAVDPAFKVKNGRIRQSVMGWCFNGHFKPIELAKHCKEIGLVAIEGVSPEHYPEIRKLGLAISLVGSPHFKLLFDIYHVAIMNGDIIRRIREYKDVIGHYHTAGNPGRGELDNTQEINYPPILEAILETGYTGFVAQEFIPTWDDPLMSLRHAAEVCDV
jgi:hypothetical protein